MEFEQTTTYLFTKVTNLFRLELEKKLKKADLHSGQIYVLLSLWKKDGVSQIDLAKELDLSPPTINKMVKSLETKNFITCSKCPKDGRAMRVFLTKKGFGYRGKIEEKWREFEKDFFQGLNETERLIFFQLLDKIKTRSNISEPSL